MNKMLSKANVYPATPFDYATLGDAKLEEQARDAAATIHKLQRGALFDIGRELVAMKERLAHGQFDKWVEAEFSWSKSTALNMMHVAREFGDEYATVAYLPPAMIYQLAAPSCPAAVRDTVRRLKPGERVDVSSIKRMISDAKRTAFAKDRRAQTRAEEAEAVRQTGLTREERFAKQRQAEMEQRQVNKDLAAEAAEKLRLMLGGYYAEFREMMKAVDPYCFNDALREMLGRDGR